MSPIAKICPEDKELNFKTGRCIKKCKINQYRDIYTSKCKSLPKKSKNNIVNANNSSSYKSALSNFEYPNTKKRVNKFKTCPNDKELNFKTGRCVKKCKINQYRDIYTSKCKTIPKAGRNDPILSSTSYKSALSNFEYSLNKSKSSKDVFNKLSNSPKIIKDIENLVSNYNKTNRSKFTRDIIKMSVLIANEKKNPRNHIIQYTPPSSKSK
jgi:hypothetical protein